MLSKTVVAVAVILVGFGFVGVAAAEIIVSDTFDVGASPTIGDDPDDPLDIAWTVTHNGRNYLASKPALSGNALRDENGSQRYRATIGQLPESITLASVGDSLSLQLKFAHNGTVNKDDAYRIGIVDSQNAGYVFRFGAGSANLAAALGRDGGGTGTVWEEGLTIFQSQSGDPVPVVTNSAGYELELNLTRTVAGLRVTASIDGFSLSYEDTDAPQLVFNAVGSGSGDTTYDWYIDNVLVDATVVPVPEPSALALAAVASLGLLVRSRRILHGCCSATGSV